MSQTTLKSRIQGLERTVQSIVRCLNVKLGAIVVSRAVYDLAAFTVMSSVSMVERPSASSLFLVDLKRDFDLQLWH